MLTCTYSGLGMYAALAWALASTGYGIGVALYRTPLPGGHGSGWGGHLMSYALVSAGVIAVIGSASSINSLIASVQSALGPPAASCQDLPEVYTGLGMKAFLILAIITGIGMGTALIPIVGPALANVFSVIGAFPGLALSVTLITSFTLVVFLTVFGSLAMLLAPAGVALMAVPAGKLKGIGAWLIAAAIAFAAAGPYIPAIGMLACSAGGVQCSLDELTNPNVSFNDVFSLVSWLVDQENNQLMKMWRFALGSLAGWGLVMAAAAALSKGIGGVAASLGFG
ncbi:MAG: hypothetical protein QXD32_06685 [Nitrososphaerota archaeon]